MQTLTLFEHDRVRTAPSSQPDAFVVEDDRILLAPRFMDRLRRLEKSRAAEGLAFDWDLRDGFRAQSLVGVVQVPGLSVEILPKICSEVEEIQRVRRARGNLIAMLHEAGDLPAVESAGARLAVADAPLFDQLVCVFARRLVDELRAGVPHLYVTREENLAVLRGKLLMAAHLRQNSVRKERFFVEHEEFSADALVGRIYRATVTHLLAGYHSTHVHRALLDALFLLDDVSNSRVRGADIDRLPRTRAIARQEMLLSFCRLVLEEQAPTAETGGTPSYSLLFPMESLYERFLERFVQHRVLNHPKLAEKRLSFHPQGRNYPRYLASTAGKERSRGVLRLKPDLLFECRAPGETGLAVLDAKWKMLGGRAARADLYQMFGYVQRFRANCTLLYPKLTVSHATQPDLDDDDRKIADALSKGSTLKVELGSPASSGEKQGETRTIRAATVNLDLDLLSPEGRKGLGDQLATLIGETLAAS